MPTIVDEAKPLTVKSPSTSMSAVPASLAPDSVSDPRDCSGVSSVSVAELTDSAEGRLALPTAASRRLPPVSASDATFRSVAARMSAVVEPPDTERAPTLRLPLLRTRRLPDVTVRAGSVTTPRPPSSSCRSAPLTDSPPPPPGSEPPAMRRLPALKPSVLP